MHWELHDRSIDRPKYKDFLKRLQKKMAGRPSVLYQDNLKVHCCEESTSFMEEAGIEYIWAPYYSPEYNAIEFFFSQLKRQVKKRRLAAMVRGRKPTYKELVTASLPDIEIEKIDNCIEHVLKIFKLK